MNNKILELELKKSKISVSHTLHLILTLLTGIWIVVWIVMYISANNKRRLIDEEIALIRLIENKGR